MSAEATHGAGNAREFPQTGRSMKHKSGDRPLTVEEYHRECLRRSSSRWGRGSLDAELAPAEGTEG